MKILIVEDNEITWNSMKKFLEHKDYMVDLRKDLDSALKLFEDNKYNIIILDLMLAEWDWLNMCDYIRQKSNVPVIIATAKSQREDKIIWLELWADEYLTKPFDLEVLEKSINNLKIKSNPLKEYNIKNIKEFLKKREILKDNEHTQFDNYEFLILEYLLKNIWDVVSEHDIIKYIWSHKFGKDIENLDYYISKILEKTNKKFIKKINNNGYKIEPI